MTKPTDLKSAGHSAVQVLYKRSPQCSKIPQNALLQPLSHNNIRKTGSIRNRQVISSSLIVGSTIHASVCDFSLFAGPLLAHRVALCAMTTEARRTYRHAYYLRTCQEGVSGVTSAYIEIVGAVVVLRYELTAGELRNIGSSGDRTFQCGWRVTRTPVGLASCT